jgi:uncharacterized protein YceH (UPF0502 family)
VSDYSYVRRNGEYDVCRIDEKGRYRFAHVPYFAYRTDDFSFIDDTPPEWVRASIKANKLTERIEQLEAKVRQLQDQLDHHDHKTPIDFTVEIEHK